MITAVIDTNILASGSLARTGSVAEIMDAIYAGRFRLAISEHVLTELMHTLENPYFAQRLHSASRRIRLGAARDCARRHANHHGLRRRNPSRG